MARKDHKPDMSWIRGSLRGQIQQKHAEAERARGEGDKQAEKDALRIAEQWQEVYDNSDPNEE